MSDHQGVKRRLNGTEVDSTKSKYKRISQIYKVLLKIMEGSKDRFLTWLQCNNNYFKNLSKVDPIMYQIFVKEIDPDWNSEYFKPVGSFTSCDIGIIVMFVNHLVRNRYVLDEVKPWSIVEDKQGQKYEVINAGSREPKNIYSLYVADIGTNSGRAIHSKSVITDDDVKSMYNLSCIMNRYANSNSNKSTTEPARFNGCLVTWLHQELQKYIITNNNLGMCFNGCKHSCKHPILPIQNTYPEDKITLYPTIHKKSPLKLLQKILEHCSWAKDLPLIIFPNLKAILSKLKEEGHIKSDNISYFRRTINNYPNLKLIQICSVDKINKTQPVSFNGNSNEHKPRKQKKQKTRESQSSAQLSAHYSAHSSAQLAAQ